MNSRIDNAWHRWINQQASEDRDKYGSLYDYKGSVYTLPVIQNILTEGTSARCYLGEEIHECPILKSLRKSLDDDPISKDQAEDAKTEAMAHTCPWHLLDASIKGTAFVDWNEGAVQTEGDRAYWDSLYRSLSSGCD